jgi:hypothetical protein
MPSRGVQPTTGRSHGRIAREEIIEKLKLEKGILADGAMDDPHVLRGGPRSISAIRLVASMQVRLNKCILAQTVS